MVITSNFYSEVTFSKGDHFRFLYKADKGKVTVEIIPAKNAELQRFYHTGNIAELEVHLSSTETKGKDYMKHSFFEMPTDNDVSSNTPTGKANQKYKLCQSETDEAIRDVYHECHNNTNILQQDLNNEEIQQTVPLIGIRPFERMAIQIGDQTAWFERFLVEDDKSEGCYGTLVLFHYKGKLYTTTAYIATIKSEQIFQGSNLYSTFRSNRVDVLLFTSKGGKLLIEILHSIDREVAWVISKELQNNDVDRKELVISLLDLLKLLKQFSIKTYKEPEAFETAKNNRQNERFLENSQDKSRNIFQNKIPNENTFADIVQKKSSGTSKIVNPQNRESASKLFKFKDDDNKTSIDELVDTPCHPSQRQKMNSIVKSNAQQPNWKIHVVCDRSVHMTALVSHYFSKDVCSEVLLSIARSDRPQIFWPSMHPHLPDKPRYLNEE